MKHEIINHILNEFENPNYLEIGFGDGYNFDKIKAHYKLSIDPNYNGNRNDVIKATSDEFFKENNTNIDIVFVDGLHHCDQVRKDIINAMKCNVKAIILHDTIPHDENMQKVPRAQKQWTGDVWRAVVGFKESYPDVKIETYRADYGLTVIYPQGKKVRKHFENMEMSYEDFKANEVELLNIID